MSRILTGESLEHPRQDVEDLLGKSRFINPLILLRLSVPQNFNVESRGLTTAQLRWTNSTLHPTGIEIERALEDGSFALVTTLGPTQISFHDTGLTVGTRYRYRLRTTDGTTTSQYTAIKTVVTQQCNAAVGFFGELTLPRLDENEPSQIIQILNEMMQMIEDRFNLLNEDAPIGVCVVDGAVVIDCSHGTTFEVEFNEDINSISFINCDGPGTEVEITFRPTGTTTTNTVPTISGFPEEVVCCTCGTAGTPLKVTMGELKKFIFKVNQHGVPVEVADSEAGCGETPSGSPGGGGPAGLCPCEPDDPDLNLLTVTVCTPLKCSDAEPKFEAVACGGTPPYIWSLAGGGGGNPTIVESGDFDREVKVTPPNSAAVGGIAYARSHNKTTEGHISGNAHSFGLACALHGCEDEFITCSSNPGFCATPIQAFDATSGACAPHLGHCTFSNPDDCVNPDITIDCVSVYTGDQCTNLQKSGQGGITDHRTGDMINQGCVPCGVSMNGLNVIVTDAVGTVVVTILSS